MLKGISKKNLFLIDCLGALTTAILLGFVLTRFHGFFGMPRNVLHLLSAIAFIFCLYSLVCHIARPARWQSLLKGIAFANLAYSGLTLGLMVYFWERITPWGILYFAMEASIIVGLAILELRVSKQKGAQSP